MREILQTIISNILTALYQPFWYAVLASVLLCFLYLYAYYPVNTEYSCAVTPQVRQTGNRLSGLAGTAYASLLT